jgi:GTP cyclohydrolase II
MQVLRKIDEFTPGGGLRPPADGADRERSCIRADRARHELRRGRPVALAEAQGAVLLLAAVEALDAPGWAALQRRAVEWRVLQSGERHRALGGVLAAEAVALPAGAAPSLTALRARSGLSSEPGPHEAPAPHGDGDAVDQPPTEPMCAAMRLVRQARLAPACVCAELPAGAAAALAASEILVLSPADVRAAERPRRAGLRRLSEAAVALAAREDCRLVVFGEPEGDAEHVAVLMGRPDPLHPVPVRVHSACLTGDLLGSLRCDCGEQLRRAVERLAATGGVLLYLDQEGRGIGLANKLRAYRLQDQGLDTFEADRRLGFCGDLRDFAPAAAMLDALGIRRVQLLTNNPRKIEALRRAGIEVAERLELVAPPHAHNARYLAAKREQAGHYV